MQSIIFNKKRWPLVIVTFREIPTEEEFDQYLDTLTYILQKRTMVAYVFDLREAGRTPRSQKIKQGKWLKDNKSLLSTYSIGTAFVFSSPIFRFILSSIFLIQPLPNPYKVCAELEEGIQWAEKQLWESGIYSYQHNVRF